VQAGPRCSVTFQIGKYRLHHNTDLTRGVDPAEAHEALRVVERMRRTALERGLPPRWLGGALAVIVGAMVGAQAADAPPEVGGTLLITMCLVMASRRRLLMALARRSAYGLNLRTIAIQGSAVVLVVAMLVAARIGYVRMGLPWAPWAAGACAATTMYLLFEYKVSQFRASIEQEQFS
jgi:hypothetical protein